MEGSSGCWSYTASSFLTDEWCQACLEMSRDVSMVVSALFEAGAQTITIKDFHRTGYNLFPELIDSRATLISGYRRGSIPGIGSHCDAQAVMFLGMHAASGSDGFLAHTMTSRIARLEVNQPPVGRDRVICCVPGTVGNPSRLFFRLSGGLQTGNCCHSKP